MAESETELQNMEKHQKVDDTNVQLHQEKQPEPADMACTTNGDTVPASDNDMTKTEQSEDTHTADNVQAESETPTEQKSSVLLTEGSFVNDSVSEKTVPEPTEDTNTGNLNVKEDHVEQISQETVGELQRTQDAAVMDTLSDKLDNISIHDDEEDEKEPAYMTPIPDPYARAIKYMEHHNVMQIFQKLTAEIIYHRPDDPLTHMLGELQKMKKDRESNPPRTTPE